MLRKSGRQQQAAPGGWCTALAAARRIAKSVVIPELAQLVVAGLDLDGVVAAGALVNFLLDQPVRLPVRRLTPGLVRSFEQDDHDQGLAGLRRPASEGDASVLTMDRRLGSLAW